MERTPEATDRSLTEAADALNLALGGKVAMLLGRNSDQDPEGVAESIRLTAPLSVVANDDGEGLLVVGGRGLHGGAGIPVTLGGKHGSTIDQVIDHMFLGFPPRKAATATFTVAGDPVGISALYRSPEIGLEFHVLWTAGNVRIFAGPEQVVESLGVTEDTDIDLTATLRTLASGIDVRVPVRRAAPSFGL